MTDAEYADHHPTCLIDEHNDIEQTSTTTLMS